MLVLVCEKTDFYQPCVGKHCEDCQLFVQKSWTKAAQMKEAQGKSLVLVTPVMMMMTMMKKVTCPSFFDSCDFLILLCALSVLMSGVWMDLPWQTVTCRNWSDVLMTAACSSR